MSANTSEKTENGFNGFREPSWSISIDPSHKRPSFVPVPVTPNSKSWKRNQYLASLAANFGAFQIGAMFGWSATALPYLREDEREIITTVAQESWISSVLLIGALVSGPLGGYCNEKFGRRLTMLVLTLPCLIGWALIFFAQNVEMVYAGRFLLGVVSGTFTIVAPIYVAETSDPDVRGKLSVGFDMGIALGILYVQVIGAFVYWDIQTLASAALAVVGHLLLMVVPETPRYLVSQGKFDEAKKSLCWLKNTTDSNIVEEELNELKEATLEQKVKDESSNPWTVLFQPHVLKPLLVSLCLHFVSAITGITPINAYTVDIFRSVGTQIDEFLSTVIFSTVGAMASVVSALVVDRFGRRPLLLISQLLMTISLAAMGIFYYLKRHNDGIVPAGLDLLPISSLCIFIWAFAFGTGPLTYTIQGEILPPEAKGVGASIITSVRWIASFLTSRFFVDILFILGEDGGYWLFASLCFVGAVYVVFWVPETKGKTLEQIQLAYVKQ